MDYNEAMRLRREHSEALTRRGIAKAGKRKFDDAIADYNISLNLRPEHADTYSRRGKAKYDSGLHQEALDDYQRAIKLDSNHADTMYYLAGFYARQNPSAAALTWRDRLFRANQRLSPDFKPAAEIALEWLVGAIALDNRIRDDAVKDTELAPILNDPRFEKLLAEKREALRTYDAKA